MNITVQNNFYFKLLNIKNTCKKVYKSFKYSTKIFKFKWPTAEKYISRIFQLRPAVKNENLHQTSDRWE